VTRLVVALVTVAAISVLGVAQAEAAAPNYIFVSGPGLARPVLLSDWRENLALFHAAAVAPSPTAATVRGLRERPRLDLAHFWGWAQVPPPTKPRQANQHGKFWPAHGSQPAVILRATYGATGLRLATPKLLKILQRHGIPVRL
jgi:hypothetical protein